MSRSTLFLIAKYVPDLARNEPRNIGVVVWSPAGVATRFFRRAPKFVRDKECYRRWIDYWESLCAEPSIQVGLKPVVDRTDPEWPMVLMSTSEGNYGLEEGGEFLDDLAPEELEAAAEQQFRELVK